MPTISVHKDPSLSLEIAPVFAALGDNTRLAILGKLQDGSDHSISKLTCGLPLTRQGVTRHLRVLEDAGLVHRQSMGRETRYRLEARALKRAEDYLARASGQWDAAIARLGKHIED